MCFDSQQFVDDSQKYVYEMKQEMPETVDSFYSLFRSAMSNGALSFKEKELIALGISLSMPCAPSVVDHTKKALAAGATKQEVIEACSVAIFMTGNIGFNHTPLVMKTIEIINENKKQVKK